MTNRAGGMFGNGLSRPGTGTVAFALLDHQSVNTESEPSMLCGTFGNVDVHRRRAQQYSSEGAPGHDSQHGYRTRLHRLRGARNIA